MDHVVIYFIILNMNLDKKSNKEKKPKKNSILYYFEKRKLIRKFDRINRLFLFHSKRNEIEVPDESFTKKNFFQDIAVGEILIHKSAENPTNGLISLQDVTFIIPIKIDGDDRLKNFKIAYKYLRETFKTNIIIYESGPKSNLEKLIENDTTYFFEKNDCQTFHRTRYLNFMLNIVNTPVTVNYDIDVILKPESYILATKYIIDGYSLVFPYEFGFNQLAISREVKENFDANSLNNLNSEKIFSKFGFCQFFNTNCYKKYGGENENFISYGPEDIERYYRFNTLTNKVGYLKNHNVYHMEHQRGPNSSVFNPFYDQNVSLLKNIRKLSKNQLIDYYKNADYIKKYNFN